MFSRQTLLSLLLALPLAIGACAGDDQEQDPNCDNGQCDGIFGWIDEGESCYDFNSECSGELTCRPVDLNEEEQSCEVPGAEGAFCDDNEDCAGELTCHGEIWNQAGTCDQPRVHCFEDSECTGESPTSTCRPELLIGMSNFCGEPGPVDSFCNNDNDCVADLHCRFDVVDTLGICSE